MTTLLDIAKKSGVSKAAVSRILNTNAATPIRVSEETRRRVLETASQLGYRPNTSARAVSTGRFGCIGLVLSTVSYRSKIGRYEIQGIHNALAEYNMHMTIGILPDETLSGPGLMPKVLREWTADGLLIHYTNEIPERFTEQIRRNQIPSIWLNTKLDADCVYPADFEAGRDMTRQLIRLGHRRILYLQFVRDPADHNTDEMHYSVADRAAGYEAAMAEAGLPTRLVPVERIQPGPAWTEPFVGLLSRGDRPTAALAYDPRYAQSLFHAAIACGLSVPGDLSIVTFEDHDVADASGQPIYTSHIPTEDMGAEAVRMLIEKIADPARPLLPRSIPFRDYDAGKGRLLPPPKPQSISDERKRKEK